MTNPQGTTRWLAPELIRGDDYGEVPGGGQPSKASDMYALAMVFIEVGHNLLFYS